MSSVDTLSAVARNAAHERDSLVWQATLAAARRVMAHYASKAEAGRELHIQASASSANWSDRTTDSRLAA